MTDGAEAGGGVEPVVQIGALCAATELSMERRYEDYLTGDLLYGDDFTPEQLETWYREEEQGYYRLANEFYADETGYSYEHAGLNRVHCIDWLLKQRFSTCLALGCARGDDVAPLGPVVDRFIGIEPAKQWWSDRIGGKPAQYLMPTISGDLPVDDVTVDLATSFGVLHHIANVSHVLGEISRILTPGGIFVLREPIVAMGDWRKDRPGATRNERGLPHRWLERTLAEVGLKVERRHFCMMAPLVIGATRLGLKHPFSKPAFARLDAFVSALFAPNITYARRGFLRKLAPTSGFYITRKLG